jgi:hypothetical protein
MVSSGRWLRIRHEREESGKRESVSGRFTVQKNRTRTRERRVLLLRIGVGVVFEDV